MSRALRAIVCGVCVTASAAAATGCGVDLAASKPDISKTPTARAAAAEKAREKRAAQLPERPSGQLDIAGEQQGSLSSNAVDGFARSQSAVAAHYSAVGATVGFARLCRGQVDIVDSARAISRGELALCNENGLEIRTPIQIASDAIVLATRNESDVGGDCLTVADVASIYRRGSTIDNWSQLGFDDLPLRAAGPDEDANAFSNFASQVLGVPSGASLNDLRDDYRPHDSDDAIRLDITGMDSAREVPRLVDQDVRRAQSRQAGRRGAFVAAAVKVARERVLKEIRDENRRRARRKEAVRDPAALVARNLVRVKTAKHRAADRARRTFDQRFDVLKADRTRDLTTAAERNGVIGFVRFGYYEAYEDELRPMEIDAGAARDAAIAAADRRTRANGLTPPTRLPSVDGDGNRIPNCIFPSQQTITTGEYPLSRRILLYTSTSGLQRPEVRAFLAYALVHSQDLATSTRLVPITDRLRRDQYRFVTGKDLDESVDKPLPGEQAAVTTTRSTQTTTTTTTTPQAATPSTAASARGPAAGSVPGVSSSGDTPKESP